MNARPIHFEIRVDDLDRARDFYAEVFGWGFEDYSAYTGRPYLGVVTGPEDQPGINGALLLRSVPLSEPNPINAAILTMAVDSFDEVAESILAHGGQVTEEKYALPGMAWQGYFSDPDGNIIGIHEPDENAH